MSDGVFLGLDLLRPVCEAVRVFSMPVGAWLFHCYCAIYQAGNVWRARRDHEVLTAFYLRQVAAVLQTMKPTVLIKRPIIGKQQITNVAKWCE